ncbi:MAG: DUF445 family protein [Deltaproteobacteria bacterium]|nr:DUF445 family protein [Deltaproteobacteria bacterium]MBV8452719.1 DUF445 family protein [Deltaproteobacteria bacterium]
MRLEYTQQGLRVRGGGGLCKRALATIPSVGNWRQSSFVRFLENHKGNVVLSLSVLLYLLSWPAALLDHAAAQIMRAAGEASLVGGICDLIALNMIFERHWYLPNSGVLERSRDRLIDGIAKTIERDWLRPDMIEKKLHQLRLLDRLGDHLMAASLKTLIRPEQLEQICDGTAHYLEPETIIGLVEQLTSRVKPARALDRLKIALVKAFARRECERLREKIRNLPRDEHLMATVDSAIQYIGATLRSEDTVLRKTADHWMDRIVQEFVSRSKGEIAQMVRENLNQMPNEKIREQIESRTRTHLDWIRVNGGVFGALLGCLFALLNAARYDLQGLLRLLMF